MKRVCIAVDGKITISWYPRQDTCNGFNKIYIYGRKDIFSVYGVIDSIPLYKVNSYVFLNGINYLNGSFFVKYKVQCSGFKYYFSDTISVDVTPPPQTDPDSVSVQNDGSVVVGWSALPSIAYSDTKSFILYKIKGGNFPIDTVKRNEVLFATDSFGRADLSPVSYRLAPVDSCDNVAALGNIQTTAFLSATQDSCKYQVLLTWSAYGGWVGGVKNYDIFYSQNQVSGFIYAGSSVSNQFVVSDLLNSTQYFFYVRAVRNSANRITSSSNRISVITNFERDFSYVYIKSVSVEGSGVKIRWTTNANDRLGHSLVYRGRNKGSLKVIADISGSALVNNEFSFIDYDLDVSTDIMFYQVISYNTCGHLGGKSAFAHNIVLKLVKKGSVKQLSWNSYDGWSGGVMLYDIRRIVENKNPAELSLFLQGPRNFSFMDNDSFFDYERPGICYRIRALEGDSDKYGFIGESYSNSVCYIDPPIVFIPNAFVPDQGVNTSFKPNILFGDSSQSDLSVYNRWGELIFDTREYNKGWDGRMKDGTWAPSDVYMYYIKVFGLDNTLHVFKGSVTLL